MQYNKSAMESVNCWLVLHGDKQLQFMICLLAFSIDDDDRGGDNDVDITDN